MNSCLPPNPLFSSPAVPGAGGPRSIASATPSSSTDCCSPSTRQATGAPPSRWPAPGPRPSLPVSGADALKLGLKPGPQVGALLEAVERWWIDTDFSADRAACLAELKRRVHDSA